MTNSVIGNAQVEKIVLGAILQSEDSFWELSDSLSMEVFSTDDHKKIYAVVSELATVGKVISPAIVSGRVGKISDGQDADGYISMLLHLASREEMLQAKLPQYLDELLSLSARRRLESLANSILKSVGDLRLDPNDLIERTAQRMADISRASTIEKEHTLASSLDEVFERANVQMEAKQQSLAMRPCLAGLTEMIGFIPTSSLILWGGGPGGGKTAIAAQQAIFSAEMDGEPTTFFELEMDNRSLVTRALSGRTGVTARDAMLGLTEDQLSKILDVRKEVKEVPLRLICRGEMTMEQVAMRARAHKRKHGLRLLLVDHMKLLGRANAGRMSGPEIVYKNGATLKALAKELDCAIIALCQFTKEARAREENPEPEMEDFYGGALEEHADMMLANFNRFAWLKKNPPKTKNKQEEYDTKLISSRGKIEVYKLKDRFGEGRDRRIFNWNGRLTRFEDQDVAPKQNSLFTDEPTFHEVYN